MATAAKKKVEIGLALQGGGALGAYERGAATALLAASRADAITEIDFQDPDSGAEPSPQAAFDDHFGLRDFSGATIAHRRHLGYLQARKKCVPLFENHHLTGAPPAPAAERRRRAART
jgi:hypothetical protein